ncbi:MAG: hypothetical protein M0R23_09305 [Bacteroidales bacterium]|jgi:hypothetical protein|nr:hypothetical protein [Bacteroidales bacterium]
MSKNNIIVLILCMIIFLASACFFYLGRTNDSYYAVYLDTGELYIGHLSTFPVLVMTDIHYIQKNETSNTLGLQKFAESVFSPEDKIVLNRDNIVWTTKLKEDSKMMKAIRQGITSITNTNQIQTTK